MQIKHFFFLALVGLSLIANAQQKPATETKPAKQPVYTNVEQTPVAAYDLNAFVAKNMRYPEKAMKKKTEGRVVVKFVVNEDGSIADVKPINGIGDGCDEEAVRVVKSFPRWKPGKQGGRNVRVAMTLPLVFKLNSPK